MSKGFFFQSLPISAIVLPCRGSRLGFWTTPTRIASGPGISRHSLSQAGGRGFHVFADTSARGGIFQALDQLRVATVVSPGRNECREAVVPGGIRVGVGADFDAGPARLIDMRDDFRHASPVPDTRSFEMPDFDRDVSLTADPDCFVEAQE